MMMIKVDTMVYCSLASGASLARVKACRGRTRTGLRQALPERAHRVMEKERKHE
jgi:hypothetical protein